MQYNVYWHFIVKRSLLSIKKKKIAWGILKLNSIIYSLHALYEQSQQKGSTYNNYYYRC